MNGEDDWDPNDLESFRNELKQLGWTIDLDTSDNYYKLKRLPNDDKGVTEIPNPNPAPAVIKEQVVQNPVATVGGRYGGGGD